MKVWVNRDAHLKMFKGTNVVATAEIDEAQQVVGIGVTWVVLENLVEFLDRAGNVLVVEEVIGELVVELRFIVAYLLDVDAAGDTTQAKLKNQDHRGL